MRKTVEVVCVAVLLSFAAAGCGDDAGATDAAPEADAPATDGPGPDARVDAPWDAAPPDTRRGRLDVFQLRVLEDWSNLPPVFNGLLVELELLDVAAAVEPVVESEGPGGTCRVWVYEAGAGPARIDAGPMTITGTAYPVGDCTWHDDALAYRCVVTEGEIPAGTATTAANSEGMQLLMAEGIGLHAHEIRGAFYATEGWPQAGSNGVHGIVNQSILAPDDLLLLNPGAPADVAPEAGDAGVGARYRIYAGLGPGPGPWRWLANDDEVTVAKDTGGDIDGFSVSAIPAGRALKLDTTSHQPNALPAAPADQTYSCDGDGDCGPAGEGGEPLVVIRGVTTDAPIGGLPPYAMPPVQAQYAVFECTADSEARATLSSEALAAVLATAPTRIATDVVRARRFVTRNADGSNPVTIRIGHGVRGYTDVVAGR